MDIRAWLREMRKGFDSQEAMADYITEKSGKRLRQSTLSMWLSGRRRPDPASRAMLRNVFRVPATQWREIIWAEERRSEIASQTSH